jgi:hypothetical protein
MQPIVTFDASQSIQNAAQFAPAQAEFSGRMAGTREVIISILKNFEKFAFPITSGGLHPHQVDKFTENCTAALHQPRFVSF